MQLVTFLSRGEAFSGILRGESVLPLGPEPLQTWFGEPEDMLLLKAGEAIPLKTVNLLQPILRPGKILAIALNYAAHAAESVSQ